jgi:hypothetical protein
MPTNLVFQNAETLSVVVTDPAAPNAGDPVRYGVCTGVALTDEGDGGNIAPETTVDFGIRVWDLSVVDEVGGGIAVGAVLFYDDALDGLTNDPSGNYFFGFALEAIGIGLTATIRVLHVPSPGAGTLGAGTIATANLAAGIISADAAGRALFAAGVFDVATALSVFAANSIANAFLLDAIADGAFQADAGTRALFADGIWTEAKLAAASLTGLVAAVVADANVIGGLPVLHRINIAGGAAGNTDVVLTHKTRIIDAWAVHTGGAGEANDTIQVLSVAGGAITDAMSWAGADAAIVRAASIDDANHEVAAGDTLRVTTTDDDAGGDVGAGVVYVLGVRVA